MSKLGSQALAARQAEADEAMRVASEETSALRLKLQQAVEQQLTRKTQGSGQATEMVRMLTSLDRIGYALEGFKSPETLSAFN